MKICFGFLGAALASQHHESSQKLTNFLPFLNSSRRRSLGYVETRLSEAWLKTGSWATTWSIPAAHCSTKKGGFEISFRFWGDVRLIDFRKPLIGLVDLADFCKIWVFQILVSNVIYCDYHSFQFTYIYWNLVLITSHTQLSKQLPVISRHFFVVSLGIFFTATPQAAVYGLLCPFLPELHGNGVHGGNLGGVGWGMQQDVKKRVRMLTKDTRKRWLDGFFGRFFFWLYPPWH